MTQQGGRNWITLLPHGCLSCMMEPPSLTTAWHGLTLPCRRYKNLLGTHWSCEVYLESWDQLLLAGRRRKKSACSKYLLGLTKEDTNRGADGVVAKVRGRCVGLEWGEG